MPNETKWTPGPWRADWDDNGFWYIEPLGVTGTKLRGDSGDCLERSNAHLIAKAPELYELLAEFVECATCEDFDLQDIQDVAIRAIPLLAKCRGEAPDARP